MLGNLDFKGLEILGVQLTFLAQSLGYHINYYYNYSIIIQNSNHGERSMSFILSHPSYC